MEIYTAPPLAKSGIKEALSAPTRSERAALHSVSSLRYERKFALQSLGQKETEMVLKTNPAIFRSFYAPRYINNIYLDTPLLHGFRDTLAGVPNRQKVRIRWYGDMLGEISRPVLEFKIKHGLPGYKISIPLTPFSLIPPFTTQTLDQLLKNSNIPGKFKAQLDALEPALFNRYHRHYYLSADRRFRATIDSHLTFHDIFHTRPGHKHRKFSKNLTVLELKYPCDYDTDASRISSAFPFRLTKSSKYAMGIECLRR